MKISISHKRLFVSHHIDEFKKHTYEHFWAKRKFSIFWPIFGLFLKTYSLVERKIHPYTVNIFAPNSPDGFHDAITRRFECQKSTGGLWGGPVPPRVKIGPIFRISDRFRTIFKSIFTRRAKTRPTYREYFRTKLSRWLP